MFSFAKNAFLLRRSAPVRIPSQQVKLKISTVFFSQIKRHAVHYNITLRRVRTTTVAVGGGITFCECISVALIIQHVVRVRHIAICCCTALHFFHVIS